MQYKIRALSALMVAAGLMTGLPHAQAESTYDGLKPSWYLIPHISAFRPDNRYGVDSGVGPGGGVVLSKPLTMEWELQLAASYARHSEAGNKVEQTLLGVNAVYLFSRSEWRPYFSMGVGAERDTRSLLGVETSGTSPYLSAALGMRYMFSDQFGVQAEYRRVQGYLRDSAMWGFKQSGNDYINVGLVWAFGLEQPRPAPRPVAPPPPPPAPPPPPPPVVVAPPPPPPPPPQRISLDASKLFELNSARVVAPVPELDTFAAAMQSNPDVSNVMITGHTDQLGSVAYNRRLSQQRADAVKEYLVSKGVAASRLSTRGVASTELVVVCKEKTRAAMITCGQPNRRVVVDPITVVKR
jgi:OOP family OmpA-OmpF porin